MYGIHWARFPAAHVAHCCLARYKWPLRETCSLEQLIGHLIALHAFIFSLCTKKKIWIGNQHCKSSTRKEDIMSGKIQTWISRSINSWAILLGLASCRAKSLMTSEVETGAWACEQGKHRKMKTRETRKNKWGTNIQVLEVTKKKIIPWADLLIIMRYMPQQGVKPNSGVQLIDCPLQR